MRWFCALLVFLFYSAVVFSEDTKWFNHGVAPVDTGIHLGEDLSAESCRSCHEQTYDEWKTARHSQAWTNPVFQEGFLVESQDRCIYCHAPMKQQFDEIKANKGMMISHEGVTCTACHVRESHIYSSKSEGSQFHPWAKDRQLQSPKFCAGCHQFNFNKTVNGQAYLTPLTVQNTYREWLDFKARGGKGTCQSCHMPEGKHTFSGAHTFETLKGAISLSVKNDLGGFEFLLTPKKVGHRLPTGDLFRHLTLEVAQKGEDFKVIKSIGRIYSVTVDDKTGEAGQILKSDTSLGPFNSMKIHYPGKGPIRYRLVYHYSSERNEFRSQLDRELLQTEVVSGEVEN
jgi:hypothetical protein